MMDRFLALRGARRVFVRARALFRLSPGIRVTAVSGVCALALSACGAVTSSNPGGGDGINDAALGVAASPRVTDRQYNLPRGGGRAQLGRPYRIAGQLYTPREDPNYDRTGVASWYGDAFHGRLTANGEVYDMHTLSAAHPTLPLPSYVRVTNLENRRSVMVRVNDRGPFSHDRIIDLSARAADVLDFRNDGVARVRVQYEGRAPLHGQDVAWLEASAQINGVPMGGGDPNVMVARAPVPAPVAAPNQIALVSTGNATAAQQQTVQRIQRPSFLDTLFGRSPANQPAPLPAPQIVVPPTAPATGAPMVLAPPSTQAFSPVLTTTPSGGTFGAPNVPIPSAAVGFMPANLEAGFTQRNQSVLAHANRIAHAHQAASGNALNAAEQLALQSRAVAHLASNQAQISTQYVAAPVQTDRVAHVQIGIFGDPSNVARLRQELASLGQIVTETIQSRGRELTQVRLHASVENDAAERTLLRELASRGYTDAYVANTPGT